MTQWSKPSFSVASPGTQEYRDNWDAIFNKNKSVNWTPPYCANEDTDLQCPACGCWDVYVREQDTYYEGGVEAYCGECHKDLEVQASVQIVFSHPELAYDE